MRAPLCEVDGKRVRKRLKGNEIGGMADRTTQRSTVDSWKLKGKNGTGGARRGWDRSYGAGGSGIADSHGMVARKSNLVKNYLVLLVSGLFAGGWRSGG